MKYSIFLTIFVLLTFVILYTLVFGAGNSSSSIQTNNINNESSNLILRLEKKKSVDLHEMAFLNSTKITSTNDDDETQIESATITTPSPTTEIVSATTKPPVVSSIHPSLLGGQSALLSYFPNKILKVTVGDEGNNNDDTTTKQKTIQTSTWDSFSQHRICPKNFQLFTNDSTDTSNVDRRSEWVLQKYKLYASRCAARNGIMWSKLSLQAHDKLATKVANLIVNVTAPSTQRQKSTSLTSSSSSTPLQEFRLLDWGSGCGVGIRFFSQFFSPVAGSRGRRREGNNTKNKSQPFRFYGLGIDLIDEAIQYAREDYRNSTVNITAVAKLNSKSVFCQADGTNLDWIPSNYFDAATAFGALLHVPKAAMCRTVSHLVRVVRKGGIVWAGYIDDLETANMLADCDVSLLSEDNEIVGAVDVTVVDERTWFRGVGIPKSNLKRKPRSIIWRKL